MTMNMGVSEACAHAGDHICGFYNGDEELESILLPYLAAGVRSGDKTVCLIDSRKPEDVIAALGNEVGIEEAVTTRQLEVKHSSETYLLDDRFALANWITTLESLTCNSVDTEGFPRIRAFGEMSWATKNRPGSEDLFLYEADVNRFVTKYPALYFCLYDLKRADGQMVMDTIKTHPKVLVAGRLFENPYYMQPDEFVPCWGR